MIKILSLFSGIGAFEKALTNLGIEYDLVNYCEIDKYASKAYAAIHNVPESLNLGDITKVDETKLPKDLDLITYGFPCQDISIAGKQKGLFNADGSQTRSGLFFEALRIIASTQPRVAIVENVKALTTSKFNKQFEIVLDALKAAGYNNYWKVLNAKDFGVAQNRERVFIVSIRKDIDSSDFAFPDGWPLDKTLRDYLDDEVDEKYYLKKVLNTELKSNYIQFSNSGKMQGSQAERIYYQDMLCPTLPHNNSGDKSQVILMDKKQVYNLWTSTQVGMTTGYAPTLNNTTTQSSFITKLYSRIRKLTPKECYRLMGFSDNDFYKAQASGSAKGQLYKQAGNSIVVDVARELLASLILTTEALGLNKEAA